MHQWEFWQEDFKVTDFVKSKNNWTTNSYSFWNDRDLCPKSLSTIPCPSFTVNIQTFINLDTTCHTYCIYKLYIKHQVFSDQLWLFHTTQDFCSQRGQIMEGISNLAFSAHQSLLLFLLWRLFTPVCSRGCLKLPCDLTLLSLSASESTEGRHPKHPWKAGTVQLQRSEIFRSEMLSSLRALTACLCLCFTKCSLFILHVSFESS